MDYSILIAELRNARARAKGSELRRIQSLLAYLETLRDTGNYIMAKDSAKEFELL